MWEGQEQFWVIIPAAGIGERFASDVPKQYYRIQQKTVLEHTVAIFLALPAVKKIIIPLSSNDRFFAELPLAQHPKIACITGGVNRHHSVFNAVDYIKNQAAQDNEWILTHDAVRPCLHEADLLNLWRTLKNELVGGILAAPVTDTLKSAPDNHISHTIPRDQLWQALTPQMFRINKLHAALLHCQQRGLAITDEASAIELYGLTAKIVPAQYANPKLTLPADLLYLNYLLASKVEEISACA